MSTNTKTPATTSYTIATTFVTSLYFAQLVHETRNTEVEPKLKEHHLVFGVYDDDDIDFGNDKTCTMIYIIVFNMSTPEAAIVPNC